MVSEETSLPEASVGSTLAIELATSTLITPQLAVFWPTVQVDRPARSSGPRKGGGPTRRSVTLMSSRNQPSSRLPYPYVGLPGSGSSADRVVPKDQPPPWVPIQRILATRPANGPSLKADLAHTPVPVLPVSAQFAPPEQLVRAPQSLWDGSVPAVSTVQVGSLPMMLPVSAHTAELPMHIVSSDGGS